MILKELIVHDLDYHRALVRIGYGKSNLYVRCPRGDVSYSDPLKLHFQRHYLGKSRGIGGCACLIFGYDGRSDRQDAANYYGQSCRRDAYKDLGIQHSRLSQTF